MTVDTKALYERICTQMSGGCFLLSAHSTNIEVFAQLCVVFGLESMPLTKAACTLSGESLQLEGELEFSPTIGKVFIYVTVCDNGMVTGTLRMGRVTLDSAALFCMEECVVTLTLREGSPDFAENLSGSLPFGGVTFSVSSHRSNPLERRRLMLAYTGGIDLLAFLGTALVPVGVDLSAFGIDQSKSFSVKSFTFTYGAPSCWLTPLEPSEEMLDDYLKLNIVTNIGFHFQNKIGLCDVGFSIEKYGELYDFAMWGMLNVFGASLPFYVSYDSERFSLSVSQCEKAQLSSAEEMGELVGESGIMSNFPADFQPIGAITLHTLNLSISSDFKQILNFCIAVKLDYRWTLCVSPEIVVSNVLISFDYTLGVKRFALAGDLRFCGVDTQLGAGVSVSAGSTAQWMFLWRMYDEETISMTAFIGQLAQALGLASTHIHLPEIEIAHVAVSYMGGTFTIHAEIVITNSRLFSSSMKIQLTSTNKDGVRDFSALFSWKTLENPLTIEDILCECGVQDSVNEVPAFIRGIGLRSVELAYDFGKSKISAEIEVSDIGKIGFTIVFTEDRFYRLDFQPQIESLSLSDLPVAGAIVQQYLPAANSFSVSDIVMSAISAPDVEQGVPAGVRLTFVALGEPYVCQLWKKPLPKEGVAANGAEEPKIAWLNVEKTITVFSLHRIGVGLDGAHMVLMADASLNLPPLNFALMGAGIGINLSDLWDVKFYLSGLALSFQNELLSISGELRRSGSKYSGSLFVRIKQISVTAIAEYDNNGFMMAYGVVSARLGGPPALFVTGFALGFGYNKKLRLPDIEHVAQYPLIAVAQGTIPQGGIAAALDEYLSDERGQRFLAAGVKFESFGILYSFALLTVSFGNTLEIGLLGVSEFTMPPRCAKSPIAHAQLALKAAIKPDEGFLGIEARLTSESYILSRDCKLTGGFAFYCWFGGAHRGDMVITLGGYRAGYQKPSHYPDVPRVGFAWRVNGSLNLSGEMYFALTPREIMAGGRLSAVFSAGNLRAYFIASADFCLGWKPFHYDASIRVLLGVSYRVDFLFVHHTFKLEIGAGLRVWGPDFTGTAHISLYIISFDISFGSGAPRHEVVLQWDEFAASFLPKENSNAEQPAPLAISFVGGLVSADNAIICRADDLCINVESMIPMTAVAVNSPKPSSGIGQKKICVRPMGGAELANNMLVTITDERGRQIDVDTALVRQNLPSALWGPANHPDELVAEVACGVSLTPVSVGCTLFPLRHYISLEELYMNGTILVKDAFVFLRAPAYPTYSTHKSIEVFSSTVNSPAVQTCRRDFLRSIGIVPQREVTLHKYAANAENLFSENPLVKE